MGLAFIAVAGVAAPHVSSAAAMIDTELKFAADTAARGAAYSFRDFVSDTAIAMFPDERTGQLRVEGGRKRIEARPLPPAPRTVDIHWWPVHAGVARSGEIGFTSGPVIFPRPNSYGFVFTVWERQKDGGWKYYFDGGPQIEGPSQFRPDSPVMIMPEATARSASPEAAVREVAEAEARIAKRAIANVRAAYAPYLTDRTQLMGSGGQPSFEAATARSELDRRGRTIAFEPLGARSARSADFVFTYGRAVVDGTKQGGYTRIWSKTRSGWRIVLDQVQVPPPKP